jgi:hypothetical protein
LVSDTGFIVTLGNVKLYTWQASYTGPSRFAFQGQKSGGAVAESEEENIVFTSPANGSAGTYNGAVSPTSLAELDDGLVCYSLAPTASNYFYS